MHHCSRPGMTFKAVLLVLFCSAVTVLANPQDEPTPAFAALAAAGSSYINDPGDCPGLIPAVALHDNLDMYTVIDLRSEFAYLAGHIPGAYPSSLGSLLYDLGMSIPTDKPIVLVGYTGQTAAVAKFVLEMVGYEDVKVLHFGMSAWNTSLDYWSSNVGNDLVAPETGPPSGTLEPQGFPALEGDPGTIIQERAAAVLAAGFRGVSYAQIAGNLEDYFIINYFGAADFEGNGSAGVPGHIPGSFQFTPYSSLAMDQLLDTIPGDRPVVVYGWTGQHSAQLVTYLNMLGYDAYSLKFGANALFYDSMVSHRWSPAAMNDFPLSTDHPLAPALPGHQGLLQDVGIHPNPFNPSTVVRFHLNAEACVDLEVFDLQGRRVARLLRGEALGAGSQTIPFGGRDAAGRALAAGSYLYRLQADGEVRTGRMLLVK